MKRVHWLMYLWPCALVILFGSCGKGGKLVSDQLLGASGLGGGSPTPKPTSFPLDQGGKVGFSPPTSLECDYYRKLWTVDDEFFCEQWHLINRGSPIRKVPSTQTFTTLGKPGADLRLEDARRSFSGAGVRIYVTDDGLVFQHPDINANYTGGKNNCTGEANSTPRSSADTHGTMVTGIIAAVANNGIGVSGVAPESKVFVNNYVSCQTSSRALIDAVAIGSPHQLWSGSFGIGACSGILPRSQLQTTYDAYTQGSKNNILYFKANGNDNGSTNCIGIGNTDPSNTHYAVASIAAIDHLGAVTSYSTRGPNLLVANFAGYGGSSPSPGIVTITGSNAYTANMNGTSAATPATTGAAALLLEAAPGLRWFDYQVILARGATIIDEPASSIGGLINYAINEAGYRHSYAYGFGVVDTDASLSVALNEHTPLPDLLEYKVQAGVLPTSDATPISVAAGQCAVKNIAVDQSLQIFSAELSLSATVSAVSDLIVNLISPKGVKSQIIRPSRIPGSNLTFDQYFKSMQPMGVMTPGTWKVELCTRSLAATFNGAKLNFFGFAGNPIPVRPQ